MGQKQNCKGMSLLELIVALAILGILAAVFLSSFSGGFTTIIGMGHKSTAVTEAQTLMDKIYEAGTPTSGYLTSLGATYTAFGDPYTETSRIRFDLSPRTVAGAGMTQVDLMVFYNAGKASVKLSALIP